MGHKKFRYHRYPCRRCRKATVLVNTDGACPGNGQPNATAGVGVYWSHDHDLNVKHPLQDLPATNNNAELAAIATALRQIRTDSKYAFDALTQWMDEWKNRGWRRFNGEELKNRAVLEKVDAAEAQIIGHVRYRYVPRQENKEADDLARQGVKLHNYGYDYN